MNSEDSQKAKNILLSSEKNIELDILMELTRDAIRKVRKIEFDGYGIHPRRYALLLILQDMDDIPTPAQLARRLVRERHSVSELLSKMEKDKLVKKVNDVVHKNRVRVLLTKKGSRLTDLASKRESIHAVFSILNKPKLQHLYTLLERIRDSILVDYGLNRSVPHVRSEDLDYLAYLLLVETTDEIIKLRQKQLAGYGIHYRRAALLMLLHNIHESPTAVEIAHHLCRERNSVSELLNKMERDGLIRKVHDSKKQNIIRFELTENGQKAYIQSKERRGIKQIISRISKKEQLELEGYLLALYHKALEEIGGT
ncbi:MAG: MarR family transcriptional regulator [Deltaproteobacteria bacterium]|nr:MarR family transcriptional regulator [Deltaproteobacteria bacterium]